MKINFKKSTHSDSIYEELKTPQLPSHGSANMFNFGPDQHRSFDEQQSTLAALRKVSLTSAHADLRSNSKLMSFADEGFVEEESHPHSRGEASSSWASDSERQKQSQKLKLDLTPRNPRDEEPGPFEKAKEEAKFRLTPERPSLFNPKLAGERDDPPLSKNSDSVPTIVDENGRDAGKWPATPQKAGGGRDSLQPKGSNTPRMSIADLKGMLVTTKKETAAKNSMFSKKNPEKDSVKTSVQSKVHFQETLQTPKVGPDLTQVPSSSKSPTSPSGQFILQPASNLSPNQPRSNQVLGVGSRSKLSQQSDFEESGSDVSFDLDHVYMETLKEKREARRQTLRNIKGPQSTPYVADKSTKGITGDRDAEAVRRDYIVTAVIGVFFLWVLIFRMFIYRYPELELWLPVD